MRKMVSRVFEVPLHRPAFGYMAHQSPGLRFLVAAGCLILISSLAVALGIDAEKPRRDLLLVSIDLFA